MKQKECELNFMSKIISVKANKKKEERRKKKAKIENEIINMKKGKHIFDCFDLTSIKIH